MLDQKFFKRRTYRELDENISWNLDAINYTRIFTWFKTTWKVFCLLLNIQGSIIHFALKFDLSLSRSKIYTGYGAFPGVWVDAKAVANIYFITLITTNGLHNDGNCWMFSIRFLEGGENSISCFLSELKLFVVKTLNMVASDSIY